VDLNPTVRLLVVDVAVTGTEIEIES